MTERVEVRTPSGEWLHANGRKVHDFPVVWVEFDGSEGRVPWPASDVRPVGWP